MGRNRTLSHAMSRTLINKLPWKHCWLLWTQHQVNTHHVMRERFGAVSMKRRTLVRSFQRFVLHRQTLILSRHLHIPNTQTDRTHAGTSHAVNSNHDANCCCCHGCCFHRLCYLATVAHSSLILQLLIIYLHTGELAVDWATDCNDKDHIYILDLKMHPFTRPYLYLAHTFPVATPFPSRPLKLSVLLASATASSCSRSV